MSEFKIKNAGLTDQQIRETALIHLESINLGFLSQLGADFLFYLYKSIYECSETELIVATDGGRVIGFITGASSLGPAYKHLLRHYCFKTFFSVLPHLFSFTKAKKIVEIFLHARQADQEGEYPANELLSLAVRDEYRRSGIARELFERLKEEFGKRGISVFKIIVGDELYPAQKFYERMGAFKIGELEVHKGSKSIVYKVEI